MFALVLKNSILMLLIIFIVHFMILNYVNDISTNSYKKNISSLTTSVLHTIPVENTTNVGIQEIQEIHNLTPNTMPNSSHETDLQDLYDYVFNENEDKALRSNDQLDPFFSNEILKKKHVDVPCIHQPDILGETKDFCLSELDNFIKNNTKTPISYDNDESTIDGNHPIIFEYNESDQELHGFETYESSFMKF
jgi:hypothetical protein